MAAKVWLSLVASMCAGIAVWCLVPRLVLLVRRRLIREKTRLCLVDAEAQGASYLRNGIVVLKPLARLMLRNRGCFSFCDRCRRLLGMKGVGATAESICSGLLGAAMVVFVSASFLSSSALIGFVGVVALGGVLVSLLHHQEERLHVQTREAIPDAIRALSVCTQVGFSLQQMFQQVATQTKEPLSQLFQNVVDDVETGKSVHEALEVFKKNETTPELSFIAVALQVQHKAGGSLRNVLDAAADSVESELEFQRSLRVQTAQARLSARIVSLMPFILIAAFSCITPGFMAPFFTSPVGVVLFLVAVLMQAAGIVVVRRVLKVGE